MQPDYLARLPDSFTVYLARHATPDRSRYDIAYHTLPGPELTARGLQEAQELGRFLQEARVCKIFSSPFERAMRTAAIASELAETALEINPDLSERQPTEFEATLVARMQRAFEIGARFSAEQGAPMALVSHGAPVMILLRSLGLPGTIIESCRVYDNRNMVPMAGVWWVEREDGELNMRMAFAPEGYKMPEFQGISIPKVEAANVEEPQPPAPSPMEGESQP